MAAFPSWIAVTGTVICKISNIYCRLIREKSAGPCSTVSNCFVLEGGAIPNHQNAACWAHRKLPFLIPDMQEGTEVILVKSPLNSRGLRHPVLVANRLVSEYLTIPTIRRMLAVTVKVGQPPAPTSGKFQNLAKTFISIPFRTTMV